MPFLKQEDDVEDLSSNEAGPQQYRILLLCLQFIDIVLFSVIIALHNTYLFNLNHAAYRGSGHEWTTATVLGFLFLSFLWILYVTIRSSRRKPTLHPGYSLASNLISWTFLLASTTIAAFFSQLFNYRTFASNSTCSNPNPSDRDVMCSSDFKRLAGLRIFACTFAYLVAILHFILFVCACRDCRKWKRESELKTLQPIASELNLFTWKKPADRSFPPGGGL